MESLALMVAIILFTSILGGPVAILLTYLPNKPKHLRIFRTIAVVVLSLIGIIFGIQLALSSGVPSVPRLIGFISVITSVAALLFEFKILKHKFQFGVIGSDLKTAQSDKIYAVIFKSKRQDANSDLYYQNNDLLQEKIKTLPGYIKHFGIRHPESREGVTVAYFESLEAINQWRKDAEHMDAKKLGKSHFYENYSLEITEVIDSYGWDGESR